MTLPPEEVRALLDAYPARPAIAAIGSHSAIDIADGAASEGLRSIVLCESGRDATYSRYFRRRPASPGVSARGCVDDAWTLPKFREVLAASTQERLRHEGALLVPNRALSSYVPIEGIESDLRVPLVGSRSMLRIEERTERENYYTLLTAAGIPIPQEIPSPDLISGLVMVKLPHATRRLERGFFTAASPEEYRRKSEQLIQHGTIAAADLAGARIESYVLGPVFNFNFFFSPLAPRTEGLELLGVDERRESTIDGLIRLPASQQLELPEASRIPQYTIVGHSSLTVRESILEEVFRLGEKFVDASRSRYPPGIIGPFCLQTCLDRDGHPTVFDVAARIGGAPIHLAVGHPYGNALYREPMSTGRRIALEIRLASETRRLKEIVT